MGLRTREYLEDREEQHSKTVKCACTGSNRSTQALRTNPTKLQMCRPCLHCKDVFYILKILMNRLFLYRAENKLRMHTFFLCETTVMNFTRSSKFLTCPFNGIFRVIS